MAGRSKKKKEPRPIFDSIRKPTPPPSVKMDSEKREIKAMPSLRKTKHKRKVTDDEQ